jgi:hypothetical protein
VGYLGSYQSRIRGPRFWSEIADLMY